MGEGTPQTLHGSLHITAYELTACLYLALLLHTGSLLKPLKHIRHVQAIQAAAKARSAAETALARACPATQGTFRQLTHEMAEWARVGHAPSIARHDADTLPLVYPGPLTQMVSLRLSVAQLEVHSPKTTLPQAIAT